MKISLIIPCYNSGQFLQETLDSIRAQNHPDLEVIVMDGGSTDNTTAIVGANRDLIQVWVSEPDRGQTHAINKGLARMTGEVWAYINADDLLEPGALAAVERAFASSDVDWLCGDAWCFGEDLAELRPLNPSPPRDNLDVLRPWKRLDRPIFPFSGACFLRDRLYREHGGFDESFHYSMDMEYYTRLLLPGRVAPTYLHTVLGRWRQHSASKTSNVGTSYGFREEEMRIARLYRDHLAPHELAALNRDIADLAQWVAVAKAVYPRPRAIRSGRIGQLLKAALLMPRLLAFRPYWGALRQTLSAPKT